MMRVDDYLSFVDERYADILYNGGVSEDEDIFDYIKAEDIDYDEL